MASRRFCSTVVEESVKKKSLFKRIFEYGKNIADDYQTVAKETLQDMKESPVKSTVYISMIAGLAALFKTRPTEKEFYARLTENSAKLMLVGSNIRNPHSEKVATSFSRLSNEKRLTFYNVGVCTLLCEKSSSKELGLYSATSKYVKPFWTEFHKTIIDVGVFGKWINLDSAMEDYDINPEEWLENGDPNKDFSFYKEKSLVSWDMKV